MISIESPQPTRRSVDAGIVPMINIVFLLLLYFLVAGRITDDSGPAILLPEGGAEKSPAPATLTLEVTAAGEIFRQGQPLDDGSLAAVIVQAAGTASRHMVIRADTGAQAGTLHKIMRQAKASGFGSVELATLAAAD